ncbi:MAG: hypothetical protein Kow0069_09490 [Promethearchaeota archaeon]
MIPSPNLSATLANVGATLLQGRHQAAQTSQQAALSWELAKRAPNSSSLSIATGEPGGARGSDAIE